MVPQGAKYHNIKSHGFDSKKEERRWNELLLLQRAKKISGLKRQVPFVLIPTQYENGKCVEKCCKYVADFAYYEHDATGKPVLIVEDVKGYRESAAYSLFVVKRKLMLQKYGIRVREV